MVDPRRILAIGARGFIGSWFVPAATDAGFEVVTTSRTEGAGLVADLLDPESLAAALDAVRPGIVINLGAAASVAESWDDPVSGRRVNVDGVAGLLSAVAACEFPAHVVCLSSAEVYGEVLAADLPVTEAHGLDPVTPYGKAKAAMEEVCKRAVTDVGLRVAVIRSFNQIGPGQRSRYVSAGIARRIAEAEAEGLPGAIVSLRNPGAARDFIDVRDGARALVAVCEGGLSGTFNLCSGTATRVADLAAGIAAHSTLSLEIEEGSEPARPADVPVLCGSPVRFREASGWEPALTLDRSLADLLESWRAKMR